MSGTKDLKAYIPSSPAVWLENGELRIEWRHLFSQLWERTGGSQGTPSGGTITGVTAGPGLAGGGTSGTVTISLSIPVTIGMGGTGATTAAQALTNLGALPLAGGTMTGPLNYTATGGNTSRAAQGRAAEMVNVKDYGAVGDGSTDDYAAINAAVAAAAGFRTVYFPPSANPYMLSQAVVLPNGVDLYAYPSSATIKPTPGNNPASGPVLISCGNAGNNLIYGLTIDGGGSTFPSTHNVCQVYQCANVVYDHCTFQNTRGIALLMSTNVSYSGVRHCTFTNIGNYWKTTANNADRAQAFATTGGTVTNNIGCFVINCIFSDIGSDTISIDSAQDFLVEGSTFYLDNGQLSQIWNNPQPTAMVAAVYAHNCTSGVIRGNRIFGVSGNAIDTPGTTYAVIANNFIRDSGQCGIGCFGTSGVVTGNIVLNSARWPSSPWIGGISISSPTLASFVFSGNIVTDVQTTKTQQYAIQVLAGTPVAGIRVDGSNVLTGNVLGEFSGPLVNYSHGFTRDNRIVNPCFLIDQPNEGAAYPVGGGNKPIMDGWQTLQSQNAFTMQRSTATAFDGCGNTSLLCTLSTSRTAAAGDIYSIYAKIEGDDVQDLAYGTAKAKPLMLCFWSQSSVAGTYSVALTSQTASRSYTTTFVLAANTPTYTRIQIPGDTAVAITAGSGYEFMVSFDLGSGTNKQTTTLNAWKASANLTVWSSQTAWVAATAGATFNLSGVRLFSGTADVGWTQRSRTEELALCRRRYRKTFPVGTAVAQNAGVAGALTVKTTVAASHANVLWNDLGGMRPGPTITTYNPSAANANWRDITAAADVVVSVDAGAAGASSGLAITTGATVAAQGDILAIHATADAR